MRLLPKLVVLSSLLTAASAANAQVYRCVGKEGKSTFQQVPCDVAAADSKVDLKQGSGGAAPKWELVSSDSDGKILVKVFLDMNNVRAEGSNRRATTKVETTDVKANSAVPSGEVEVEYLVDCVARRETTLLTKFNKPKQSELRGNGTWNPFPKGTYAQAAFEKICEVKLPNR